MSLLVVVEPFGDCCEGETVVDGCDRDLDAFSRLSVRDDEDEAVLDTGDPIALVPESFDFDNSCLTFAHRLVVM